MRRRLLGTINWRYAVGEVALIVIGILIALAASEWQAGRAERRTELALLADLRTGLAADHAAARSVLDSYRDIAERLQALLAHMDAGGDETGDLPGWFGAAYGFQQLGINRAAYESLKSQGLDLVSDPGLRSALARLYEQSLPLAEQSVGVERNVVLELLRPFYLRHFRDLRFNVSAQPLDYAALVEDTYFRNLLDYRLQVLLQNHINTFETFVPEIEGLLARLDAELVGDDA